MNYYSPVLGKCVLGAQAGPQVIVVRQLVGEEEGQQALDIRICVPRSKPAVEQVIDVRVQKLRLTDVRVMTGRVVVCGDFAVKAIYAACLPTQPVHAAEARKVRFTFDLPVLGARWGMDAEARVMTEFVDYYSPDQRLYWEGSLPQGSGPGGGKPWGQWGAPAEEAGCFREFSVSVVLRANVKVMTDREVVIYPGQYPGVPGTPKG